MNGDVSEMTPLYERTSGEASSSDDREVPVIEQLIEKKRGVQKKQVGGGVKEGGSHGNHTRPDIVPVDEKGKIYFLINHNQGTISHVIKTRQVAAN